jgi:hypothetical protein
MDIGLHADIEKGSHMVRKFVAVFLFLFLAVNAAVFAQKEDLQSNVAYKVNKMKTVLNLTDSQVTAIRPIIKDYLTKRSAILEEVAGEGIVDHVAVKTTLDTLKEDEFQKLSKILSKDQLEKWINKENLMAALNPDTLESPIDDGPSFTSEGANFKF